MPLDPLPPVVPGPPDEGRPERVEADFLRVVGGELRIPLTLLVGPLTDLTAAARDRPLTAAQWADLDTARGASLRLARLVDTLLEVGYAEVGTLRLSAEPTDMPAFTALLAEGFRPVVERAGLRMTVDCPSAEPVRVDRAAWEKVVVNLLSNAVRYTLAGGITVRTRGTGGGIVLEVADTGVGIAAEHLPRILEWFHRVSGGPARSPERGGIGLALVAELVRLHGGTVDLRSEPGSGTTVSVRLPPLPGPPGEADKGPAPRPAQLSAWAEAAIEEARRWLPAPPLDGPSAPAGPEDRPPHVLVVDGTADVVPRPGKVSDMLDYLHRLLAAQGWTVDLAGTAADALVRAGSRLPDLVVADVARSGADPEELVAALRSRPGMAGVPVVLVTARAGPQAAIEGLRAGADDYLSMPFSGTELVARVRTHLELAAARRDLLEASEQRAANLEVALATREVIGTAMGMIMVQQGCDSAAAFDALRESSQRSNRKLAEIARQYVSTRGRSGLP